MEADCLLGVLRQSSDWRSLRTCILPPLPQCRPLPIQDARREATPCRLDQRRHLPRWFRLPNRRAHLRRGHLPVQFRNYNRAVDHHGRSACRLHHHAEVSSARYQRESTIPTAFLQATDIDQHAASGVSILWYYPGKLLPNNDEVKIVTYPQGHDLLHTSLFPIRQGRWRTRGRRSSPTIDHVHGLRINGKRHLDADVWLDSCLVYRREHTGPCWHGSDV